MKSSSELIVMKHLKRNYTVEVSRKLTTVFIYLILSFSESESESWFHGTGFEVLDSVI